MKVLFFAHDNYNGSGAFISLVNLAYILTKDYKVDCKIILPYSGNGEQLLNELNLKFEIVDSFDWIAKKKYSSWFKKKYWHIKKIFMYGFNLFAIRKIECIIKDFKPDIIHINTLCTYVGAIAAYRQKIPVIWHIREFLEEDWGNEIFYPFGKYRLINKSNRIICITACIFEKFEQFLDTQKMIKIYNGVSGDKFLNIDNKNNSNKIILLCVGSLVPQKGQELIIRALPLVIKNISRDLKVYFVGEGSCLGSLKELAYDLSVEDFISFEGHRDDTENYYHISDITIVPSYFEPFGRVTVEAMLSGSFVIGTDTAGTKEIIGLDEYGALFKNGDYRDLANKLLYYIQNEEKRNQIAGIAREYALKYFTAQNNASEIFELYKKQV